MVLSSDRAFGGGIILAFDEATVVLRREEAGIEPEDLRFNFLKGITLDPIIILEGRYVVPPPPIEGGGMKNLVF